MRIVHSFWSKPTIGKNTDIEKINGGFRNAKFHWMSWALSCLTFKDLYGNIELYTDQKGKEILIDKLKLPYSKVHVELDHLNHYPEQLWAIGKLHTYRLQNKPFIHVDGDVFCWNRLGKKIENAELIGQSIESGFQAYHEVMQLLEKSEFYILDELKTDFSIMKEFNATNAGIIGGTNLKFIKEYTDRAFYFIDKNLNKVNKETLGNSFAIMYEQYLFAVLARKKKINIEYYIRKQDQEKMRPYDFLNRFFPKKYVHLLGPSKSVMECCRELELHLMCDYPEWYEKINSLIKD